MKREVKNVLCIALVCIMSLSMFSGCIMSKSDSDGGKSSADNDGLILILGNHAQAREYDFDHLDREIEQVITRTENEGQYIYNAKVHVIINDGRPEELALDEEATELISNTKSLRRQYVEDMVDSIQAAIESEKAKANDSEADLLAALGVAADIIANDSDEVEKYKIIAYDSGICTTGGIDMAVTDINNGRDVTEIVKSIQSNYLCDLQGAEVTIPGLGNISDEQDLIHEADKAKNVTEFTLSGDSDFKKRMESFWCALIEECNGNPKKINWEKHSDKKEFTESDGYQKVSKVEFTRFVELQAPAVGDSEKLGFLGGTATFKEGSRIAEDFLKNYIEEWTTFIEADERNLLYVVGSIAVIRNGERHDGEGKVSYDRAVAVKDILVDLGIPADRIVIINGGTTVLEGWRDTEEFPEGATPEEIESNQDKNRVVAVIPNAYYNEKCSQMMQVLRKKKLLND